MWLFRVRKRIDAKDRWFVELDGAPVAMIANPVDTDMFWFTWDVLPLESTPVPEDLWNYVNDARRSFRHIDTGERSTTYPGGEGILPNGRVLLRGPLRNP